MNRRKFVESSALLGLWPLVGPKLQKIQDFISEAVEKGELLYNGIQLPKIWPPNHIKKTNYEPMEVPYLKSLPSVIPIDLGRQLFVDDFLIESSTLKRSFHKPKKRKEPVFKPESELDHGKSKQATACPKDGGVWWDAKDQCFKMWYEAGWLGVMAYATSKDGINWERPIINKEKNNNQIPINLRGDSSAVFIDHDTTNPEERYKMLFREPNFILKELRGECMVSADGINWNKQTKTGFCGDRTTMFYNPFRKKWIYSLRDTPELGGSGIGRSRYYSEHSDFLQGADWNKSTVFWTGADKLDKADPRFGDKPQLYNLSAVGYESIMLGLHQIHLGPSNDECEKLGIPKTTELMVSYSRDGFHWDRPDREAFIPAARNPERWDNGYVQSVGGICTIMGDELWFYYIGFQGRIDNVPDVKRGMYANASTGVAVLRRDGFASMDADQVGGTLTTRLVTFNGSYLFVNVNCPKGNLVVEILDEKNNPIPSFTAANCKPIAKNSTIFKVEWKNKESIAALAGKKVSFRFKLTNGQLFSFWVSPNKDGASQGYMAAGGPGYKGAVDDIGINAYNATTKIKRT